MGLINTLSTLLATAVIDKAGRKILLLLSLIFMTICLSSLGLFFFLQNLNPENVTSLAWLPLTSLSIYVIAFSIGFGPIPWVIFSEIFSYSAKSMAAPVVGFLSWIFGFVVSGTFEILIRLLGSGPYFWVFAGITSLGIVFTNFLVPETKGLALSDIQRILSK